MVATTSAYDLEVLAVDQTTWIGLMLSRPLTQQGAVAEGEPVTVSEALTAADADLPVSKRLAPVIQEDFSRGLGLDYNEAPGVYTRTPGYALPAGAATDVTIPATHNSFSPFACFEEYGGSLWVGQQGDGSTANTSRVLVSTDGTGVGGGAFAESITFGASDMLRDMLVSDDGAGNPVLWVSTSNPSFAGGRMHKWDGSTWTSSTVGAFGVWGRNKLAKVWWVTKDGNAGLRLVAGSSSRGYIAYTRPDSDPLLAASWVEGVKLGTGYALTALASSRHHVFGGAIDGLFDLDELGNSPNLTSYTTANPHPRNAIAAIYHDGYVYMGVAQGLDRVRVDEIGALQETPGMCAPGWGTQVENAWGGHTTALAVDQGYLVDAIYSPSLHRAAIFWGKDRQIVGVDSPNPLIWYGPEVVSAVDTTISKMRVAGLASQPNALRLWLASWAGGPALPALSWVSLPIAGSPLQDLTAGGPHRFATGTTGNSTIWQTYSRLELMPETWGDKTSTKILYQTSIGSRGLDVPTTTQLVLETRADPDPGSTTYTTSDAVTVSPSQDVTPAGVVKGNKIWRRIGFFSPSGGATPARVAVLDAVRTTAWKIVPDFGVRTLQVEYGAGVVNLDNVDDGSTRRDADWVTKELTNLTRFGRTTLRDRADKRWTVVLNQVLDRIETLHDGDGGKSVLARLEVDVLAEVA